jgi:hypothetical protein
VFITATNCDSSQFEFDNRDTGAEGSIVKSGTSFTEDMDLSISADACTTSAVAADYASQSAGGESYGLNDFEEDESHID